MTEDKFKRLLKDNSVYKKFLKVQPKDGENIKFMIKYELS